MICDSIDDNLDINIRYTVSLDLNASKFQDKFDGRLCNV